MKAGKRDIEDLLMAWHVWSTIDVGGPRRTGLPDAVNFFELTDDEAMVIDAAFCQLRQRWPDDAHALMTFLRCGGNMYETARRLHCAVNTVRIYVGRAESWMDAKVSDFFSGQSVTGYVSCAK